MNFEQCIEKQPDIGRKISLYLPFEYINIFSSMSKTFNRIVCQSNEFWLRKYKHDNKKDNTQPSDWKWLDHYKKSLCYLSTKHITLDKYISRAVKMISCGWAHFGIITVTNNLYLAGHNYHYQLSADVLSDNICASDPVFVKSNVTKIFVDINIPCILMNQMMLTLLVLLRIKWRNILNLYHIIQNV